MSVKALNAYLLLNSEKYSLSPALSYETMFSVPVISFEVYSACTTTNGIGLRLAMTFHDIDKFSLNVCFIYYAFGAGRKRK